MNADYTIQKLLEKDLIEISGRKSAPGSPLIYNVSQNFMDHFGLKSMEDLPQIKDIVEPDDNSLGTPAES